MALSVSVVSSSKVPKQHTLMPVNYRGQTVLKIAARDHVALNITTCIIFSSIYSPPLKLIYNSFPLGDTINFLIFLHVYFFYNILNISLSSECQCEKRVTYLLKCKMKCVLKCFVQVAFLEWNDFTLNVMFFTKRIPVSAA